MIDKDAFAHQMGILGDRFGRPLAPPTLRQYFTDLSGVLSTEEFVAATSIAFRRSRFWPSPLELIELVRPDKPVRLAAGEAFNAVVRAVGNYYEPRVDRLGKVEALGAGAVAGFRACGGFDCFDHLELKDEPFARNRFIEAYEYATAFARSNDESSQALAAAPDQVRALVREVAQARSLPPAIAR